MDHSKLWKILKEMRVTDHLTCLLRNPGLEEAQDGIKIARRTSNNLRYADDSTLMAETYVDNNTLMAEEDLKAS